MNTLKMRGYFCQGPDVNLGQSQRLLKKKKKEKRHIIYLQIPELSRILGEAMAVKQL